MRGEARLSGWPLLFLLAGCVEVDSRYRIDVRWPEQHVVFVADTRTGTVLALAQDDPARLLARTRTPLRAAVLDLRLDKARGRLWVLGGRGIDVHDAHSLVLQKHIALRPDEAVSLRHDGAEVGLYSRRGVLLGRVDARTLELCRSAAAGPEKPRKPLAM